MPKSHSGTRLDCIVTEFKLQLNKKLFIETLQFIEAFHMCHFRFEARLEYHPTAHNRIEQSGRSVAARERTPFTTCPKVLQKFSTSPSPIATKYGRPHQQTSVKQNRFINTWPKRLQPNLYFAP